MQKKSKIWHILLYMSFNRCDMEMNGLRNQVIGDALLSLITQPYVR